MIQEIIVGLIGLAVAAIVLYRMYTFFFVKKEKGGRCGCSSCGCSVSKKHI